MNAEIEDRIKKIIETSTKKAAIAEWTEAIQKQMVPLYNYRFDHVQQVVALAKHLAEGTDANMDVITLAAWLHDIDKPGVGGNSVHGEDSARLTEEVLVGEGVELKLVEKVSDVVRQHVGLTLKKPLQPIEAQILWEADKVLKLGMIGLLQYILNGTRLFPGRDLSGIAYDVREFLSLASQVANCVVTERGKEVAEQRLQTLNELSRILDSEVNLE